MTPPSPDGGVEFPGKICYTPVYDTFSVLYNEGRGKAHVQRRSVCLRHVPVHVPDAGHLYPVQDRPGYHQKGGAHLVLCADCHAHGVSGVQHRLDHARIRRGGAPAGRADGGLFAEPLVGDQLRHVLLPVRDGAEGGRVLPDPHRARAQWCRPASPPS